MRADLSADQLRIVTAIQAITARTDTAPTLREVCQEVGIRSHSTVLYHVRRLVLLGAVRYESGRARTLRVA